MLVARAGGELIHIPTPDFSRHCLIEKFKEGGIAAFKVIPERLTFPVVQRKFDPHAQFIDIKVDDLFEIVRDKVKMCKLPDHKDSYCSTISLTRPTSPLSKRTLIPCG